ncbi:MAG TPA: TetR/AcrR family transcriptional regulator [Aliidongia sp.]|nr:TetR/AcrR family transcriptional regulator [Aliidongia sp.]
MGHSQAEKAQTHERIVNIAARRLREKGLDGIGVAELMQEAGLTVGGFYRHFGSRDDLVQEAIAAAFAKWRERTERRPAGGEPMSLSGLVDIYLSLAHRDNVGGGCTLAALMGDIARSGERTRALATDQVRHDIDQAAALIGPDAQSRAQAILVFSALLGAIGLARAVSDEELSAEILSSVRTLLKSGDQP